MNKGTQYEKFAQEIYQNLLKEEGVTTEVRHNVKVPGKSTQHQIDIYWEYRIAGITHKVAIECKNYNKRISKNIISSFYGVLSDIGNTNGIIITKMGFQKGAKDFADHYGINLVELREPHPDDWKGRLRILRTKVELINFHIKKWYVQLDEQWCRSNLTESQLASVEVDISGMNSEIWLYDSNGNPSTNFQQLQDQLPYNEKQHLDNKHSFHFRDTFIASRDCGHLKIIGVYLTYDILTTKRTYIDDSLQATKAILKNVSTGEIKFIKHRE